MNFSTTITRTSSDLAKVEYRFYNLRDLEIVLDSVVYYERPTKRHGWRVAKKWEKLMHRQSTMEREEPPQDVKDKVRHQVFNGLTFN